MITEEISHPCFNLYKSDERSREEMNLFVCFSGYNYSPSRLIGIGIESIYHYQPSQWAIPKNCISNKPAGSKWFAVCKYWSVDSFPCILAYAYLRLMVQQIMDFPMSTMHEDLARGINQNKLGSTATPWEVAQHIRQTSGVSILLGTNVN